MEFGLNIVNLFVLCVWAYLSKVTCATWLFGEGHIPPIIEVSHPTNKQECLTDYDSNVMSLWFDGDCMPKMLIDNDELSDSEKSYNDYEEDFVINAK